MNTELSTEELWAMVEQGSKESQISLAYLSYKLTVISQL
jgi:hypothetical protein